jgi:hypothetical protein
LPQMRNQMHTDEEIADLFLICVHLISIGGK